MFINLGLSLRTGSAHAAAQPCASSLSLCPEAIFSCLRACLARVEMRPAGLWISGLATGTGCCCGPNCAAACVTHSCRRFLDIVCHRNPSEGTQLGRASDGQAVGTAVRARTLLPLPKTLSSRKPEPIACNGMRSGKTHKPSKKAPKALLGVSRAQSGIKKTPTRVAVAEQTEKVTLPVPRFVWRAARCMMPSASVLIRIAQQVSD